MVSWSRQRAARGFLRNAWNRHAEPDLNNYPTDASIVGFGARHSWEARTPESLQLRVLRVGLFVDGDVGVGVGVFPKCQEVVVRSERPHAGSIGFRSRRVLRLQSIRPRHSPSRQRPRPAVPYDSAVVENLLELGGSLRALSSREIGLTTNVGWVKACVDREKGKSVLSRWDSNLQSSKGGCGVLVVQCRLRLNGR